MSGATSATMVRVAGRHARGHNRITPNAIRQTVEAVTARAFRVGRVNVTASLEDDAGKLGVSVSVKLTLAPLMEPRNGTDTVFELAQQARTEIVSRGAELTGLEIGRVDIRLTGGNHEQPKERRVA
ncbi:hypothetical protein [Paenarthrobacter nitroguajacolicus]|uniref:hypothetical protein n=1 Tax=Paenarthrobacter nitroguajacolicus TaxID=211146 RepID=UPI004053CC29